MQRRLKNIFSNRLLQSLLFGAFITLIVSLVWDIPLKRFEIKHSGENYIISADNYLWFFDDFDNDGDTERLRCFNSTFGGRLTLVGYNHQNQIISTMHFKDDFWTRRLTPAVADINKDGKKEFLFFSLINDSVFFTAVDVLAQEIVINHLFFMQVEKYDEKMALLSEFYPESLTLLPNENELLFYFDAGYGLYPRGLFKLNFKSGKFVIPQKTYSPYQLALFKDLNKDGKNEILTNTYAPSNVAFETEYTDKQSYITGYDSSLDYLFPPVPVQGEYSYVKSIAAPFSDTLFYSMIYSRATSDIALQIAVISASGQILRSKKLPSLNLELNGTSLNILNNNPHLFINNFGYYPLTPNLEYIPYDEIPHPQNNLHHLIAIEDLDKDGYDEIISQIPGQSLWIYNTRYDHFTSAKLTVPVNHIPKIVPFYKDGAMQNHLFVAGPAYFSFNYWENPWYFMVYFIYISLFIFFSGVIYMLLFLQQRRLEKRWEIEKQLSELQFNSVKNQLHPHFMFNALNSVAYMVNTGQKEEAYDFLTVNSRMIQQVMDDAREVKRTLSAEISFTKDYLKVQQHRFKERFTTEFNIHPEVDFNVKVPKMCIHTYVENAIKHGFRNTKSGGLLRISISPVESGVMITITDNGMGRKDASAYHDSTGHGLAVMDEFYRLFEKYHGYQIKVKIKDLKPVHDNQTGTQVELKILHK